MRCVCVWLGAAWLEKGRVDERMDFGFTNPVGTRRVLFFSDRSPVFLQFIDFFSLLRHVLSNRHVIQENSTKEKYIILIIIHICTLFTNCLNN